MQQQPSSSGNNFSCVRAVGITLQTSEASQTLQTNDGNGQPLFRIRQDEYSHSYLYIWSGKQVFTLLRMQDYRMDKASRLHCQLSVQVACGPVLICFYWHVQETAVDLKERVNAHVYQMNPTIPFTLTSCVSI